MFEVVDEEVEGAGHRESQVGHGRNQTNPIWPMLKKNTLNFKSFFYFKYRFQNFFIFSKEEKWVDLVKIWYYSDKKERLKFQLLSLD